MTQSLGIWCYERETETANDKIKLEQKTNNNNEISLVTDKGSARQPNEHSNRKTFAPMYHVDRNDKEAEIGKKMKTASGKTTMKLNSITTSKTKPRHTT